ncbi:hypothetical protein WCWAEYFT_CDS0125 [Vibrio phage VB_VaC_TDDLMA]
MIYFRRNNGEVGKVSYNSLEDDLEMIKRENRVDLRSDIINSISRYQPKESFELEKPIPNTAFMVLVK